MTPCPHTGPVNMDHVRGDATDPQQMVSRFCMQCGWHLYGPVGDTQEYTRKEWDAWIATAFDPVPA